MLLLSAYFSLIFMRSVHMNRRYDLTVPFARWRSMRSDV